MRRFIDLGLIFRNRGLVQYFSPYISADLAKMAISFNTTIPNLVR